MRRKEEVRREKERGGEIKKRSVEGDEKREVKGKKRREGGEREGVDMGRREERE